MPSNENHEAHLPATEATVDDPTKILLMLFQAPPETQPQLAKQIAFAWAKRDINAMWSALSRSSLDHDLKQVMYNELWG